MKINTGRVVVAGLVAGVLMFALDYLVNGVLLMEQNRAALAALKPDLAENAESAAAIAYYFALDLAFGLIIVWTYAAMRPRFGPGPRTAFIAGGLIWLVVTLMYKAQTVVGLWEWGYFITGSVLYLVVVMITAYVGARLYREDPPEPVGPEI